MQRHTRRYAIGVGPGNTVTATGNVAGGKHPQDGGGLLRVGADDVAEGHLVQLTSSGTVFAATESPPHYGADRYCVKAAQAAVVVFNQRVAGADEKQLGKAVSMMKLSDPAMGLILEAVVKRMFHGAHPPRTRRAIIHYSYGYCMDTSVPPSHKQ